VVLAEIIIQYWEISFEQVEHLSNKMKSNERNKPLLPQRMEVEGFCSKGL
jgi:hypothetical protein